jgi:hypothetical protein
MNIPSTTPNEKDCIFLQRFSTKNAELVMSWRNARHVRANFLNDAEIKLNDHLSFVNDLENRTDRNFFIVHISDRPVGCLNINVSGPVGYWGCYLGDDNGNAVRPGFFSILIGISGLVAFNVLNLDELRSDVVKHNTPPQKMNDFLKIRLDGFRQDDRPSGERIDILSYVLPKGEWPLVLERIYSTLTKHQIRLLSEFATHPKIEK